MINKKNKRGAIFQDKPLIAILVVVVVLLVLGFFVFKVDFKEWFNIVFDFNQATNTGNQTMNVTTPSCTELVAEIGKPEGDGRIDHQYIYFQGKRTELFWREKSQEIMLYREGFSKGNVQVGRIEKDKLIIFTEYRNENSEEYKKYKDILPSIDVLNSLNGLYYFSNNALCKASFKTEEKKI